MAVQGAAGYVPRAGTQGTEHMLDGQGSFAPVDRLAEEEALVGPGSPAPGAVADSFEMTNRFQQQSDKGKGEAQQELEEVNLGSSAKRFESEIAA
ncbi:hypothetical protein JCM11251_002358 [Rhodosporidiobolus azoricus]